MSSKANNELIELTDIGAEADLERPPPPLTPRAIVKVIGEKIAKTVVRRKSLGGGEGEGEPAEVTKDTLALLNMAKDRLLEEQKLREKAEHELKELSSRMAKLEKQSALNNA